MVHYSYSLPDKGEKEKVELIHLMMDGLSGEDINSLLFQASERGDSRNLDPPGMPKHIQHFIKWMPTE